MAKDLCNVDISKKVLVFGDCHVPYHNKQAFELLLKVAAAWKPDVVVNLGDFSDFYAASRYLKDPDREPILAKEVKIARECQQRLTEACKSAEVKVFTEGNHEHRLRRQVLEVAPWLSAVVPTADVLVGWSTAGWEYVGYGKFKKIGAVIYTHDTGNDGSTAVQNAARDAQASIVIGHVHRQEYIVRGSVHGKPHLAFCPGWLGDASKAEYMHTLQANRLWCTGFATGRMLADGVTYFSPVPIINGRCIVEGKVYSL